MHIEPKKVVLTPSGLREAISSLEEAIEHNERLKGLCEEMLALQEGGARKEGRRGRVARPKVSSTPKRDRRVKNERTLTETIVSVLSGKSAPLAPKDLRDAVLATGYQTASGPKNFYVTVYNAANKADGIVRTDEGFALKGAARGKATPRKRRAKKAARKRAPRAASVKPSRRRGAKAAKSR